MAFPDRTYDDCRSYSRDYFQRVALAQQSVDPEQIDRAAGLLGRAYDDRRLVFVCGNGGSTSLSEHFACDHLKGVHTDTARTPRVVSLASNFALIGAIANDHAYEEVFVRQLRSLAERDDVLVTISSSGDSENVVRALQWARDNGMSTIAMTGFDGGRSRELADVSLHVRAENYGVIEDTHQSLLHVLAQFLRMSVMDEELVRERKF